MKAEYKYIVLSVQCLDMALLVDTVGNKEVEWKITSKHFIKVFGQFPEASSITVMMLLLQLQQVLLYIFIKFNEQLTT